MSACVFVVLSVVVVVGQRMCPSSSLHMQHASTQRNDQTTAMNDL